jgi:hypothetical protein
MDVQFEQFLFTITFYMQRLPPELANNPQALAQYRLALQRQQQQRQQQQQQQQQQYPQQRQVRPPVPMQRKRPLEEAEQIRIVKERIDQQIKKDHDLLAINVEPFQSAKDVLDRLLPWHLYYIQDYNHDVDVKVDLEQIKNTMAKGYEVMDEAKRIDLEIHTKFLSMLEADSPMNE